MQKKLIAVAVASAFAVPAAVMAQTSTVSISGTFYGEYGQINNGAQPTTTTGYRSYDHFQNPGSELSIKGEERIGGNMSVWFQCNSSLDWRGGGNSSQSNSQASSYFCSRASALGMKGGFGNAFYGNWDTPWKRVNVMGNTGANDTGIWGNAHIVAGGSSTYSIAPPANQIANWAVQATNSNTTATTTVAAFTNGQIGSVSTGAYRRRQNNLFTYETPNLSGFTGFGAVTTNNFASAATSGQFKSRLWSIGGTYANGPLALGAAWEKHKDVYDRVNNNAATNSISAAPLAGSDASWTLAATYSFANNLKLGATYQKFKSEQNAVALGDAKLTTYHLGVDWMFSGPHGVRAAYDHAGDVKGTLGNSMNNRPAAGPGTSASMWQIRYVYALSKRSEFTAGYSKTNNGSAAIYETGGATTRQSPGADSSAWGLALRHTF